MKRFSPPKGECTELDYFWSAPVTRPIALRQDRATSHSTARKRTWGQMLGSVRQRINETRQSVSRPKLTVSGNPPVFVIEDDRISRPLMCAGSHRPLKHGGCNRAILSDPIFVAPDDSNAELDHGQRSTKGIRFSLQVLALLSAQNKRPVSLHAQQSCVAGILNCAWEGNGAPGHRCVASKSNRLAVGIHYENQVNVAAECDFSNRKNKTLSADMEWKDQR